jgi:sugar (pentulose or hexulose) kinase
VEGLGYELNRHLGLLARGGQSVQSVTMSGWAAASQITPGILADIAGLRIHCCAEGGASLVGAAVVARGLLEPGKSLADLADGMLPAGREVQPGSASPFYQAQYQHYLKSLQRSHEQAAL